MSNEVKRPIGISFFRNSFVVIFGLLLLVFGIQFVVYIKNPNVSTGDVVGSKNQNVRLIKIRALKDSWKWEPSVIHLKKNEAVRLIIFNEDDFNHAFSVDELGVSKQVNAKTTTTIEFAPEKVGTYSFYCSIICGEGHFDMKGSLIVD